MKIDNHEVLFESTGIKIYAHGGVIGIDSQLELSQGWDGGFCKEVDYEDFRPNPFTKEEREELADHMISLWRKFKETSGGSADG